MQTTFSLFLSTAVFSFSTALSQLATAQESPVSTPEPALDSTPAPLDTVSPPADPAPVFPQPARPAAALAAPAPVTSQVPPTPERSNDAPALEPAPIAPKPFRGFSIQAEDGRHHLRLGAYVQADGRFFTGGGGAPSDTFSVRRARIDLRGTTAKYFEFGLQPELAGTTFRLLDAFGNLHFIDELQFQAGKMKSPIGLEYQRSPTGLPFPEFGLPSSLVPQRDVGFYLHGEVLKGTIAYQFGVFNGVADGSDGDPDENDDKDYEARVFLHPFRALALPALADLGLGVAGTVGEQDGALPSFRTPGRETFFRYVTSDTTTAVALGGRTRVSPQAYYYYGPFGVLGEYVRSQQEVSDGSATGDIAAQAWQVAASVVIGGKPTYKAAEVDAAFDPFAGTFGALEIAARYGQLSVEDRAFELGFADPTQSARRARSFGAALSWWFVKRTRALASFERTVFEGGSEGGDRAPEGVVIARLQLTL